LFAIDVGVASALRYYEGGATLISTETLAVTGLAIFLVVLALGFGVLGRTDGVHVESTFHRGISFGFLGDALLVVLVGSVLNPALPDLLPLGGMLALTLLAGVQVYRRQPSPIL
jgi:hypothetical protein